MELLNNQKNFRTGVENIVDYISIEYKHLIGKKKPRGFFRKGNREESIKFLISWYLFLCKVKNSNRPLSQRQLGELGESSVHYYFSFFGLRVNDINLEYFGKITKRQWRDRDHIIEYYTKKAKKLGRPLKRKEMDDEGLVNAFHRYDIVKKVLDKKIFGHSLQFDWNREIKKDPDFLLKQCKMIWDFFGRSPTVGEINCYCKEKNTPYSGSGLMTALERRNFKKSDIDIKFGTPPYNSYLVKISNEKSIIVKSLPEVYIVNMLISYGLEFDYEGLIHDSKPYLYDFKLFGKKGDPVYIEFFGLNRDRQHGHNSYSNRVEHYLAKEDKKKKLYKKIGAKLIAIDGDFFDGNDINKFQKQFYSLLKDNNIKVGKFKALCLEDLSKSKHGFKWNADKSEQALKEILKEAGRFVSESELGRMGRHDVVNAIRVHHPLKSILKVAEKLGYKDDRINGGKTGRRPKSWLPFKEARKFARSLNLNSRKEWLAYCRGELEGFDPKPENIPFEPNRFYPEFSGIHDWLGYNKGYGEIYSPKKNSQQQLEL